MKALYFRKNLPESIKDITKVFSSFANTMANLADLSISGVSLNAPFKPTLCMCVYVYCIKWSVSYLDCYNSQTWTILNVLNIGYPATSPWFARK